MVVTLEEVRDYLCIDFSDPETDRVLQRLMLTAEAYLGGSLGGGYPETDERVRQLALITIHDLYSNREMTEKVSANVRRLVDDFSMQIRLEMKRGSYGLSGSISGAE